MRTSIFFLLVSYLLPLLHAHTPALNLIDPRGGQVGTDTVVNLYGDRLYEPQEIIFYQPGITVRQLEKVSDKHLKAHLTIAPDAALGEHKMRLRCKGGITYLRTYWIGQYPTVFEVRDNEKKKESNDTFETPQEVPFNTTIQGVARTEDADYYRFTVKKGQRISAEVEGLRLGRLLFDPYVSIMDAKRFELASSDDSPLLKRDCAASVIAPADGQYTVLVRESSYQGTDACQYRLHIGEFPRPTVVYPPGGKAGTQTELTFIGDPSGPLKKQVTLPATDQQIHIESNGHRSPSGNWVRINDLPFHNEQEPNNGRGESFPKSNPPAVPVAFHGILSEERDRDFFRFSGKKGQVIRAQVFARSLRSPVDSLISVRNMKDGKSIGNNDDQTNGKPDSRLDFTIPEDGEYSLEIRDRLYKSGPDFTYRVELTLRQPSLAISLPYGERNNSQKDKMINVPRGNRLAIVPNISRANIGCDITFQAPALPAGMTANTPPVPRALGNFPVLFEATADAPIAGGLYTFTVTDPKTNLTGPFKEDIHLVEVNNAGNYHSCFHDKIAVAVIEEAPFHIDLHVPPFPSCGTAP